MLIDAKLNRLADLLDRDITRMLDDQKARVLGYDDVQFDLSEGVVSYCRQRGVLWRAKTELVGSYLSDLSLWRWWWYGSDRPIARSPINAAYAAGQTHGVPTLVSPQPVIRTEKEAVLLSNVCAVLARAIGVYRTRHKDRLTIYALFPVEMRPQDRKPSSFPPPAEARPRRKLDSMMPVEDPLPSVDSAPHAIMSMMPPPHGPLPEVSPPPQRDIERTPRAPALSVDESGFGLSPLAPVREPSRERVMPMAKLGLAAVVSALPAGFQQALVTLDLSVQNGRARFFVFVVASDHECNLVAIPTPQGMMEAARELIAEDARRGNGRWKRLIARLINKPTGVSLSIEVRA